MTHHKSFSSNLLLVVALLLSALGGSAQAQTNPSACSRGYILGYFNGVWSHPTSAGAYSGLAALISLQGQTYNGEPVIGELFYNHTGETVGASGMQDIAEVFIQRAREFDASGVLESRFEFLWDVITDGERGFWNRLLNSLQASDAALDALYTDIRTTVVAAFAQLLSNPPTAADYAEHNARLGELVTQGQKLLLVAHSQGNLFVNQAYDHLTTRAQANTFGVVHIAPASPTLRGGYRLANIDVIINSLRAQGASSVPPANLALPLSTRDLTGHYLEETYLDVTRPGRASVKQLMDATIASLVTPAAGAGIGFFTVTLTWNGSGDVDLHTFEPGGQHVFYGARTGASGYLDVDNVVANGPEHYFATCDATLLQTGSYRIGINNYSGATGRTATVQVGSLEAGAIATYRLDVGPVRGSSGNNSPIHVFTVVVTRDPVTGEFHVRVD